MAKHLLTGVTGRVGLAVANELAVVGEHEVTGLVRHLPDDESRALPYTPALGDFADTPSLHRALIDVDSALLVSNVNPDQCRLQANFVDAALAAPQSISLVKVSGLGSHPGSSVDSGRWHAETEAYMRKRGVRAHNLHPYFFMQNLAFTLEQARRTSTLTSGVDGDTPIAMVDVRDIAAVAARLLTDPDCCSESVLPLTGARSYSYRELAQLLSELLGRDVLYQVQSERELRRALEVAGQPDWHIDIIVQFNQAFDAGLGAKPTNHVEIISGKKPRTLDAYLAELINTNTPAAGRNPFPN